MWNSLPCYVKKIFRTLITAGIKPYVVGGAVRNFILDLPVCDYDIASSATPEQIIKVLKNYTVVKTGIKHGTVTVVTPGGMVEHTTFRTESEYSGHRKPVAVNFTTSLMDDLSRRDFTFNAIAYSKNSDFLDPFNGISDLQMRLVKCVGEPQKRFEEDALRILRALRFSAVLGFELEDKTHLALIKNKHLLKHISKERITAEFLKLLCGQNAQEVLLKYKEIVEILWPEVITTSYTPNMLKLLGALAPNPHLRLTAMAAECLAKYHNTNFADAISSMINGRFSMPTKLVQQIGNVAYLSNTELPEGKPQLKKLLKTYEAAQIFQALDIKKARFTILNDSYNLRNLLECENTLKETLLNNECYSLATLAVKGTDLIELGVPPGPMLGKTLNFLLNLVLEDVLPNTRDALTSYTKTNLIV